MLLRLLCVALTSVFSLMRLLPTGDSGKDAKIFALRHQLAVLQWQIDKPNLTWPERALLAALLHRLPRGPLPRLQLIVSFGTLLRRHRDLLRRRHAKASQPKRPGRPRTIRSVRALMLRLANQNPDWGYRRIHGKLVALGITVTASTVWNILKEHGIGPHPSAATYLGHVPKLPSAGHPCCRFLRHQDPDRGNPREPYWCARLLGAS
ncbi:helix-turn-helix domain-containing protein [Streptomyces sp. NPDC055722]